LSFLLKRIPLIQCHEILSQETRDPTLSYNTNLVSLSHLVSDGHWNVTDPRRTDRLINRITIAI